MKLILASKSPRRKELLTKFGFDFTVVESDFLETADCSPSVLCTKNAIGKSTFVFNKLNDPDAVVLGSDTVVYFDGQILGKPKDASDAIKTLHNLSGKTHEVYTGYSLIKRNRTQSGYFVSKVKFNKLSDRLIKEYVCSGLPMDKAGSYGIQDGYDLVEKIDGSYYNIVGLPIDKIQDIIKEFLYD